MMKGDCPTLGQDSESAKCYRLRLQTKLSTPTSDSTPTPQPFHNPRNANCLRDCTHAQEARKYPPILLAGPRSCGAEPLDRHQRTQKAAAARRPPQNCPSNACHPSATPGQCTGRSRRSPPGTGDRLRYSVTKVRRVTSHLDGERGGSAAGETVYPRRVT